MIYTKKANFPYPLLTSSSDSYKDAEFSLDVNMKCNADKFVFEVEWEISSAFINQLLEDKKLSVLMIIKSKDNQYHKLEGSGRARLELHKSKLSLNNSRTVIQLMLIANEDISFANNEDLEEFYDSVKDSITVEKGNVLGFSNTVMLDGTQKKPYDLFEKQVDPNQASEIAFHLGTETIMISYKEESLQFNDLAKPKELNYPYIYAAIQKAVTAFIIANSDNPEDGVDLSEVDIQALSALNVKLFTLMKANDISEASLINLDEIVYKLTNKLITRYSEAVRGLKNDH